VQVPNPAKLEEWVMGEGSAFFRGFHGTRRVVQTLSLPETLWPRGPQEIDKELVR